MNYWFCSPGESPESDQSAKIVYDYIPSENSSLTIGTEARPNDKDRFRDRKLNNLIKVFYLQNVMEIFDSWCRTIQNEGSQKCGPLLFLESRNPTVAHTPL